MTALPPKKLYALGRLKAGERNKTEAAYELYLESRKQRQEIVWYCFEGITLKLADNTRYTPDFAVLLANGEIELHEVKGSFHAGVFRDDAKVKIKVAAQAYPFRFLLVVPIAKRDGGGWAISEV